MMHRLSPFRARLGAVAVAAAVAALIALAAASGAPAAHEHEHAAVAAPAASTAKAARLHDGMRKLWEAHIPATRLAIVSSAAGSPALPATEGRLLRNQTDSENAIKPYYGTAAS